MADYTSKFAEGLSYADFLSTYGTADHQQRWAEMHSRINLTPPQRELLGGFVRQMDVICLAGAWCGDCVHQCPILDHFESASTVIRVRYFDRDAHPDLQEDLSICGGARVPAVLFLSEDGQPTGRYGDRTLAKYRQMAADQLGPSCPTGIVAPGDQLVTAVTQEWLDQFERNQLMLRTSPRLRKKHGD